jgi:hypothetical protein
MGWFAAVGDRKRYELPEIGGWIELRQELSIGEERNIYAQAIKGHVPLKDDEVRIEYDRAKLSFGQTLAYLVDWSESQEINASSVQALKPEIYNVIEKCVQTHVEGLEKKEPTKGKKKKTDAVPILPSAA